MNCQYLSTGPTLGTRSASGTLPLGSGRTDAASSCSLSRYVVTLPTTCTSIPLARPRIISSRPAQNGADSICPVRLPKISVVRGMVAAPDIDIDHQERVVDVVAWRRARECRVAGLIGRLIVKLIRRPILTHRAPSRRAATIFRHAPAPCSAACRRSDRDDVAALRDALRAAGHVVVDEEVDAAARRRRVRARISWSPKAPRCRPPNRSRPPRRATSARRAALHPREQAPGGAAARHRAVDAAGEDPAISTC